MSTDNPTDITPNIEKLKLSDDFYTWFLATNKLIDYVNPISLYDVILNRGLYEARNNGIVTIGLNIGKGVKLYPDVGSADITLDLEGIFSSVASVKNDDYILLERSATGSSNYLFSVLSSDILPPTLNSDHEFLGAITVASLNSVYHQLNLGHENSLVSDNSGIVLNALTPATKISFLYNTTKSAWISNRGIGISSDYSFVSDSTTKDAYFNFSTSGNTQYDVVIDLSMGYLGTSSDDHAWSLTARHYFNRLDFIYRKNGELYSDTDSSEHVTFSSVIDTISPITSTFLITDKIQIGNVGGSTTNFKQETDYTQYIIPVSNSNGILDSKWTNRYVTANYDSSIVVGDVVRIYDNTDTTAKIVKCAWTTTADPIESTVLGIVERKSDGKIWVAVSGEFTLPVSNLNTGAIYYLSSGSPNYSVTKPSVGVIKPLFTATSTSSGIVIPIGSGQGGLSFGSFNAIDNAENGILVGAGATVTSDGSTGNFTFVAGEGISLQTDPSSKQLILRALVPGYQPTYSSIFSNSGDVLQAVSANDSFSVLGVGGIEVVGENHTSGDTLYIRGKFFRTVSWSGDSSTNDTPGSLTATDYDDNINVYAGTGISIRSYADGFRIDATGSSVPAIGPNSISLDKLYKQFKNSILYTPDDASSVSEITALQSTNNSFVTSDTAGVIRWETSLSVVANRFANTEATKLIDKFNSAVYNQAFYGVTTSNNSNNCRSFGIIRIPNSKTTLPGILPIDVAAFRYNTTNTINSALVGLQEGDGIELSTFNSITNSISGIPTIKISNKYGAAFNTIKILDTAETITASSAQKRTVTNYIAKSDTLGFDQTSVIIPDTYSSSNTSAYYGPYGFGPPSGTTGTKITSITGPNSTTVNVAQLTINPAPFDHPEYDALSRGYYFVMPSHIQNTRYTYSIYAKNKTAGEANSVRFQLAYWNGSYNSAVYSEEFTTLADNTWKRFTFTFILPTTETIYKPGQTNPSDATRYWTFASRGQVKITLSGSQSGKECYFYGGQLEEGQFATDYISSENKEYLRIVGSGGSFDSANRWEFDFATAEYTMPESHGTLQMSTAGSPLFLDATSTDTINFGISNNSITNTYLATMADNTVKVGISSTNLNSTPSDLLIQSNGILGRFGSNDLASLDASDVLTILGFSDNNFFKTITTNSGSISANTTESFGIVGGSGIDVSVNDTNHSIVITSSIASTGDLGINTIGTSDWVDQAIPVYTTVLTQLDKLYYATGELKYSITPTFGNNAIPNSAVLTASINWESLGRIPGDSLNNPTDGSGILYGYSDGATFTTIFAQTSSLSQSILTMTSNGIEMYSVEGSTLTDPLGKEPLGVLQFIQSGSLTNIQRTFNYARTITSQIVGLGIARNTSGADQWLNKEYSEFVVSTSVITPIKLQGVQSQQGAYYGIDRVSGLMLSGDGKSVILASSSGKVAFTSLMSLNFSGCNLLQTSTGPSYNNSTNCSITSKVFNTDWYNLSGDPSMCLPTTLLIGTGPVGSSNSISSGYMLENSASRGLMFTNYNFNTNGSKTLEQDYSSKITLQVLNVDTNTTHHTSSKTTASLVHSYTVPDSSQIIDRIVHESARKSIKYLIQAVSDTGKLFTTEFLLQINGVTSTTGNFIQYASVVEDGGFTLNIVAEVGATYAYVKYTNSVNVVLIKVLKQEI